MPGSPHDTLALLIGFLVAIVVHEYAHARVAYALGDSTAADQGRMTLNPVPHIDPFGTLLLPAIMALSGGFIFGWAKPVPVDARNFRMPRRDALVTAFAGPAANLLTAAAIGVLVQFLPAGTRLPSLAASITLLNLFIAFFNLIPLPPLDGASVLSYVLAQRPMILWRLERQGSLLLISLLIIDMLTGGHILGTLIGRPVLFLARLFLGGAF